MNPRSLELLKLALTSVHDHALLLLDSEGTILEWLCGAEEIFGYGASEMVGKHASNLFVPEDVEKGLDQHELEVARHDSFSQDDRWHMRKDGARIWISGTVTALRDESGVRGFIKVMRDRTDLRMNTESKANHLNALEDTIQRTHRFLQTLGHELRNPLSPIKNAAFIAGRTSNDPRVLKAADVIQNQVAVLERIAADLMDVSRLQHRKLELKLGEFDLRHLVQQEIIARSQSAVGKGVRLEPVLPAEPVMVFADRERIQQAVSNLVSNSIKYTPSGGVVWVKVTQEADDVVVRVHDTGIGIAPEVLPRIFELFTQESRAKDLVPGGLGVGLAIVKQIAELHAGVAQARSGGKGKGAEFSLRIPKAGPPPEGTSTKSPA